MNNNTMNQDTNYNTVNDVLSNGPNNMSVNKINKSSAAHVQSDIQDTIQFEFYLSWKKLRLP